ncbi:MAG: DUF3494 domain-containing protein [Magnetococcales bacterium]|nr:DUF3494 domain-containing protein [Magnetococcales bacterium]
MNKHSKMLILAAMFGGFMIVSTNAIAGNSPNPVNLGTAGNFAILSKAGITNVYRSSVVGDVGTSPITGAALLLSCAEVVGKVYTVTEAGPLPCRNNNPSFLTTAVLDMERAYTEASGRPAPNATELGGGEIGGRTITPGIYKWSSGLLISTDVTLSGGPDDVWIFQVAQTLDLANSKQVKLVGGASAKNIFWAVAGAVSLGAHSHFEGNILAQTMIAVNSGATVNGALLAQTAVTLDMSTVTRPGMGATPKPEVTTNAKPETNKK